MLLGANSMAFWASKSDKSDVLTATISSNEASTYEVLRMAFEDDRVNPPRSPEMASQL
jgi:hypothetical protein